MTAGSVTAPEAGRASIVTAAAARRPARQRTARCAAGAGGASAAAASAPCPGRPGTGARSARRAETPAALRGEIPSAGSAVIVVSLPGRCELSVRRATRSVCSMEYRAIRFWTPCSHVSTPSM